MRWVCPGCGSQVSVALSQCPNCGTSEQSAAPVTGANQSAGAAVPSEAESAANYAAAPAPAEKPAPAAAPAAPESSGPRQRLLPTPRPATEAAPEPENPYWRGVKFGVGFMFAVAMILLLLAMLLLWLREQGWQPWLDTTAP